MNVVWERKGYFNKTLRNCENGDVVQLKKYPSYGPFFVVGRNIDDSEGRVLLFDFSNNLSTFFNADENVEVLQAELHVF